MRGLDQARLLLVCDLFVFFSMLPSQPENAICRPNISELPWEMFAHLNAFFGLKLHIEFSLILRIKVPEKYSCPWNLFCSATVDRIILFPGETRRSGFLRVLCLFSEVWHGLHFILERVALMKQIFVDEVFVFLYIFHSQQDLRMHPQENDNPFAE